MDSFYDMPRCAPAPTPVDKFLAAPAVPEVSLFCPSNGQMNYNAWRVQHTQTGHYGTTSQVNISKNLNMRSMESSIILKKQVRFEGPVMQHYPVPSSSLPTMRKDKIGKENKDPSNAVECNKPLLSVNTFEQMYMANIPSRQLDLSIIDLPKNNIKEVQSSKLSDKDGNFEKVLVEDKNVENKSFCDDKCESVEDNSSKHDRLPKTYQEFIEKQKKVLENKKILEDNSVTDLYNYKRSPMKIQHAVFEKKYNNSRCWGSNNESSEKTLKSIKPLTPDDNQQFFNESNSRRNLPNSQDYNFKHRIYETKQQPVASHHKCAYNGQNMCNEDQNKNTRCDIRGTNAEDDESKQISPASSSEPTNTDLLKIIAQQNEQLLLIQKQVAVLLSREQSNVKPIMETQNRPQVIGEKIVSSTQTEHFHQQMYTPKKRGLSKFSIDMMTSFEVAIRPSQHNKNQFAKIQEVTETESASEPIEPSLRLEGPVNVPEDCPSPEPTMNIEMQDYDSSDEDSASEIGVTFYKNLMGQVNNILKKAQHKTKENFVDGKIISGKNDKTMQRIKEATLKHLKNIGVTVDDKDASNNSSFSSDNSSYSPTEVSFAVKQLLMKYLPDEELAKTAKIKRPNNGPIQDKNIVGCNVPPQFSMASIEYLKKYNIIPNSDNDSEAAQAAPYPKTNRILDLTALKKQPKLL